MTETSSLILAFRQRLARAYDDIEGAQADAKEIELEAKARGLNVRELKGWVKAERKDKVAKLVADTVDRVMYGETLGHDLGMIPNSRAQVSVEIRTVPKDAPPHDPETGEVHAPAPQPAPTDNADLDAGLDWAAGLRTKVAAE